MSLRVGCHRTTAAALLSMCAVCGAPAQAQAAAVPMLSAADRTSFDRLARSLGGRSGVAVAPLGSAQPVQALGGLRTGAGWSTSKVPVAMAVIAGGDGPARAADLRAAITVSDNAAAERLWSSLGAPQEAAGKSTAQLRLAGDERTTVESRRLRGAGFTAFGQTAWGLADQASFVSGMPCSPQGRQVLALMGKIVPGQRWGLGATGAAAKLKGGWGPGTRPGVNSGYLDRQMGVVTVRGRSFAVAIATAPRDGGHATGSAHLTRIARWVVRNVDVGAVPRTPSCG